LEKLKLNIDNGIKNITLDKEKNLINLIIDKTEYEINLYSNLENIEQCKAYLRNSFFYQYLTEKTNK
jgi:hypothetical protein